MFAQEDEKLSVLAEILMEEQKPEVLLVALQTLRTLLAIQRQSHLCLRIISLGLIPRFKVFLDTSMPMDIQVLLVRFIHVIIL